MAYFGIHSFKDALSIARKIAAKTGYSRLERKLYRNEINGGFIVCYNIMSKNF